MIAPTRTIGEQQAIIEQLERDLAVALIHANAVIHHAEAYHDARNEVDTLRDQLAEARFEQWEQEQDEDWEAVQP